MNHFRQGQGWLPSFVMAAILVSTAAAQNATNLSPRAASASLAPAIMPPPLPSPMDYFRNLLAMSLPQREAVLASKPPKIRERILAKLDEYAKLDSNDRELRLRATELHWYLLPLLKAPPEERNAQLALIPDRIRDLVQSRLMQWEILPPPMQQEFLDNEHLLSYFSEVGVTNQTGSAAGLSDAETSRWNSLSEDNRQAMLAEFNQYFDLSPVEKQQALGQLTDAQRAQMEKTLQTFNNLTPHQRMICVHAFAEFAGMSSQERAEFLKNADRWSKMSPAERKAWSELVAHVPQWPPPSPANLPPPLPPLPSPPPAPEDSAIATNHG